MSEHCPFCGEPVLFRLCDTKGCRNRAHRVAPKPTLEDTQTIEVVCKKDEGKGYDELSGMVLDDGSSFDSSIDWVLWT